MGLLTTFNETLDAAGVFANEGKMVDASFVESPRQQDNREENKHIKENGSGSSVIICVVSSLYMSRILFNFFL
jgi:cell division protein FtsI/penicillin-binding protein 2|tara:strand:+ start:880 stop:1098 length:219 start_codon:yes stop_codon:yes gene_type:complete